MHNKTTLDKPLLEIFFSHLVGDSHQVRTVISIEWLIFFLLQCSYRPSSRHDPGCCLQGA